MGMSEREYHIKVLENLLSHYKAREQCEGYYDSTLKDNVEALEYAILSIKTDEAYQIMYEGEEVFTKADLVAMLEKLKSEIILQVIDEPTENGTIAEMVSFNSGIVGSYDLIRQKINALKGENT